MMSRRAASSVLALLFMGLVMVGVVAAAVSYRIEGRALIWVSVVACLAAVACFAVGAVVERLGGR